MDIGLFEVPSDLKKLIDLQTLEQVFIGQSKSDVYRVQNYIQENFYLKVSRSDIVDEEIEKEIQILHWLFHQGISSPLPKYIGRHQGQLFFLMSALPGVSMDQAIHYLRPEKCMRLGAQFLAKMHSLRIDACRFHRALWVTIPLARKNILRGLVDETDFDPEHMGKTPLEVFRDLHSRMPLVEDLVFTHGDYCFPNIICHRDEISGVIDLGRAGIADRHQDVALFLRSFDRNFGPPDVDLFLREYHLIRNVDEDKLTFYRQLDEFF